MSMSAASPVVAKHGALRPLGIGAVTLDPGSFWGGRQDLVSSTSLAHIRKWLGRMGWIRNFEENGRDASERGAEFSDSEVYKYLEALCWNQARTPDERAEAEIADITSLLERKQQPDGYVNTAFGGVGQRPRYSDLAFGHELYCAGHLLQACVARGRTTGLSDPLVRLGVRVADHLCEAFGPNGIAGICGHPEVEMALVEFGRLTGSSRYIEQAALFIERRGHRTLPRSYRGWSYFSDDVPVRDSVVMHGHAVRALYLDCGAIDVAAENGDTQLLAALELRWLATQQRRTYVTGGMGSRHLDEGFGEDFALPPDRAYSETCAGVASVMLSWRLLLATGEVLYADAIERALFNVVAAGYGEDGASFFYANTLHQRSLTNLVGKDAEELDFGGSNVRAPWYDVSCCFTNVARLFASLTAYVATTTATGVQVHQFFPGTVATILGGENIRISILGQYPQCGPVRIRIDECPETVWTLSLRVPSWAAGARLSFGDETRDLPPGYVTTTARFRAGDELELTLQMEPRWTDADPRVDAVRGCRAVEAGPLVLCAEFLQSDAVHHDTFRIPAGAIPIAREGSVGLDVELVEFDGPAVHVVGQTAIELIPYHHWASRGPSTMRVWMPVSDGVPVD
jgi:uncharacterized protein